MSFDIVGHLKIVDNATRPLRTMTAGILKFGAAAAGIGAAVGTVAVVGDSIKKAMDFESQLQSIKALTGATETQMKAISAMALEQGALTKYSALEAAQGMEELLKAGMSEATIMSGGLNAALNLATAGGLELAEAAETMATSMNAFKKDGLSAAQTADILAGTANAAATDVRNIAYGIASAGGVADMAGVSFRDLNTAIGLMSNDGLKSGSDAGTSFKSMLMYLQPQTKKATAMFNQLGIGVGKANKFFEGGKIKDLAGIAEVLNKTLGKMNNQDRVATLLDMFGTDGVKAATTLYKAGAKGVEEFHNEMAKVTALQVAEEKMNSAAGAIEQFQGAMETLQISAMSPLLPYIKKFAIGAQKLIADWTPQITAAVQNAVDTAAKYINTNFINNPEFNKLPDLESKVRFVFDTLGDSFNKWWEAGGRDDARNATSSMIGFLIDTMEASSSQITEVALKIGASIAQGIMQGVKDHLNVISLLNPVKQQMEDFNNQYNSAKKLSSDLSTWSANNPGKPMVDGGSIGPTEGKSSSSGGNAVSNWWNETFSKSGWSGHSAGLERVPYNDYPARLHQDEMVLNSNQARDYRETNGGTGGGPSVMVTGNTFVVRNDSDIDDIANRIALRLAQ
ncbi:phage tail tape measure protein, TP901 family, core region [Paenibacillus sp. CF095]|uniref:phage tail tape measure protein n=1 Tax=Paenibacillus sp. CF095 TaxID=1881033 RepID=UPI00088D8FFA|nr:phage tail tape measure protein, TP901 family, core region [Paenibacillus sp. CF095]